jgi:hypothetical protein
VPQWQAAWWMGRCSRVVSLIAVILTDRLVLALMGSVGQDPVPR